MAIIKCKMCGGDIEISADKTFGTCEYCGSTMTLPKVDDEQRAAAFNRGNHFRRSGEFDKALAVYERIVAEDDNDAEAHWCCALCRFGIEYVEDPATYEWLPTCHRASFDSFLEDVDYLAAVEHSDGITRRQYQKDAAKIAEVQRGILATSQNEQPFDVFLCYKETGEDGQRTRDSLMAQEVYYELTEQGYRVFFARITLEDKAGAEYEPYIFAALNSAKVMVVIGTKPEHFNAVWVKNEWSRFLSMMKKDRSKLLLPCYRDMDPYDLPEALSVLQSYDMSKIGFMQDLIRGVKKVIDAGKPQEAAKETVKETVVVHNEGGGNVQALLKRGNMALEDGEWKKADEFFEQVLNQDAECGAAYLGKFLSGVRRASVQAYVQSRCEEIAAAAPAKRSAEACTEEQAFIDECVRRYQVPKHYSALDIQTALRYDRTYCDDRAAHFRDALKQAMQRLDGDRSFARAEKFASGETKAQCEALRTGLTNALQQQAQNAEQEAAAEKQRITEAYHAFLKETEPKLAEKQKQALAKQEEEQKRKEEFDRLCAEQKKRAEEATRLAGEKARKKAEKAKKHMIIGAVAVAVIVLALVIVMVVTKVIMPAARYSKAEKLRDEGNYDAAIAVFEVLGYYKDAPEQAAQMRTLKREAEEEAKNARAYANAERLLTSGDYSGAAKAFKAMGDYKDAAARAQDCPYIEAEQLQAQGKTAEAAIAFGKIAGYKDALERSFALRDSNEPTIIAEDDHIIALKADGTVVAAGNNEDGQCNISDWADIVAIDAGFRYTVGLKADGTVLAVGYNDDGRCNVSSWTDITAICVGSYHTVGLKTDGTVIAAGDNNLGQCNVSDWTDITAISAREHHTVGLKADGTVVAAGYNKFGQCDVSDWTDIVAISAGYNHTVGLKADGTVVTVGFNENGECGVSDWTDIAAVKATYQRTVGLKADGTVIAVGDNKCGQCDVSDWTDIATISAGTLHTVGLKTDGTVVAVGNNADGQCDVSDWTDIVAVNAGGWNTVGLKADGTVVIVGGNVDDKCNASDWTDIRVPNK